MLWSFSLWTGVAGIAACAEATPPAVRTERFAQAPRRVLIDPETTNWDAFDADVSISFSGPSAGSLNPDPNQSRGVSYHVHRRQDAGGRWVADFTHDDYRPEGNYENTVDFPRVAKMFALGTSATPSFYDENGNAMIISPAPATVPASPRAGFHPAPRIAGEEVPPPPGGTFAATSTRPPSSRAASLEGTDGTRTRDWLDRYIVTPRAAARTRRRLLSASTGRSMLPNGRERFVIQRGSETVENDMDPARGTIEESRVIIAGVARVVTTREYRMNESGFHVLALEHIRSTLPGRQMLRMDVEFSNLQLTERK